MKEKVGLAKILITVFFIILGKNCFAHGEQVIPIFFGLFLIILFLNVAILFWINSKTFNSVKKIKIFLFVIILILLIIAILVIIIIANIYYINDSIAGPLMLIAPFATTIVFGYWLRNFLIRKDNSSK